MALVSSVDTLHQDVLEKNLFCVYDTDVLGIRKRGPSIHLHNYRLRPRPSVGLKTAWRDGNHPSPLFLPLLLLFSFSLAQVYV